MNRALALLAVLSGCVDSDRALEGFCAARPELCDAGAGPVCPASDEFDGPALNACFQQYPAVVPATSVPALIDGGLVIDQQLGAWSWSNGSVGGLVSQELTGTFVVETRAHVRQLNGGPFLSGDYVGAGLLAADPAGLNVASRLISVGQVTLDGGRVLGPLVEVNTATASLFAARDEGFASALLRLCRFGPDGGTLDWAAFYRPDDTGPWIRFTPPANTLMLPDRVAVGVATYQVGAGEVHRMTFDHFRVRQSRLFDLTDCVEVFDGGM